MRRFAVLLIHLAWSLATPVTCAVAHPVSHTDAWVKVSDTVDVHLKVFLDDVLRHEFNLSNDQVSVPAQQVRDAIARHGDTLLKQLQVYQNGLALSGTVVNVPRWAPYSADVDVQANASLKLTWDLQFEPGDPILHSLCFVHGFTHPELTKAGELRLNLKHVDSGKRISAVIPPWRPHTLVLPDRGAASASTTLSANAGVSRLIVVPAAVVQEFTAPLLLLDTIWPAAAEYRKASEANGVLSNAEAVILQEKIANWFREKTSLAVNGQLMDADRREVVFFVGGVRAGDVEQTEWDQLSPLPLFGTTVGVQLHHRPQGPIDTLSLRFASNPGAFSDLTSNVVTKDNQVTSLVSFESQDASGVPPGAQIDWVKSPSEGSLEADTVTALVPETSAAQMVTTVLTRPGKKGATVGTLMFVALMVMGTMYWKNRRRHASVIAVLLLGVCMAAIPDSHTVVDVEAASAVSEHLLDTVYDAVMLSDEKMTVNQLSKVLEEGLVESVYLSTLMSLTSTDSEEVFVDVSSVSVDALEVVAVNGESQVAVECGWRVCGTVHHWGHSHERELIMIADIVLVRLGQQWKIHAISPTAPVRFSTEAVGT